MQTIEAVKELLTQRLSELAVSEAHKILRAPELRQLYQAVKTQPQSDRASFGQAVNKLKMDLEAAVTDRTSPSLKRLAIDVTAPFDINQPLPALLPAEQGTIHPISRERQYVADIFNRMGFEVCQSRELDDEYHMFTSLNFPENHPARDDYDTFMTEEGLVAPAHTSTMQQRLISARLEQLAAGESIAVLAMDRVFRNEDLDARHEHTFTQHEGIFVGSQVTVGQLVATLKLFFSTYYGKQLEVKITPFYFPFTEPSFEFSLACPFCDDQTDCKICSNDRFIEMLGCGMIHPNVLKMAGVDPSVYTGFAWGGGIERLVMLKHRIEDVRHFNSGKLSFLRQLA